MPSVTGLGHLLIRAVNRWGGFVANSRLRAVDFDVERLLQDAGRRTGLEDFGAMDFVPPLEVLLDAYEREAELTLIGRIAMREDVVNTLESRLRIEADRKRLPRIAAAAIEQPLFITGLPRSGTTFLHALLGEDAGWRAPAGWEVMYPSPSPGVRPADTDSRAARAQRRMQQLYWLAPEFKVIHPLDAALPQECIAMMNGAFRSDSFPTMCHIPGYQQWLNHADLVPAYRYHRRFLQQLQGGHANLRWLLKAPAHLFGLQALLEVYPDARFVFMHRDPHEVLPSLANLTLVLRSAFSDRHEPAEIGREVTDLWAMGLRRAMEVVLDLPDRRERCIDIAYEDLTSDPLDTVERLYAHFGLDLGGPARGRMQAYLQQRPKDQFGEHRYSLAQFELDAGVIEQTYNGLLAY